MQAATQDQEGDDPVDEEVNIEVEEEKGGGLATVPELQLEEDNLPTGARSHALSMVGSHVSSASLSPVDLEDRQAERNLKLELAKLKFAEKKAEAGRALAEKRLRLTEPWKKGC